MSRERVDKLGKLTMLKVIVTCARHVIFYDYFGVHVALYTVNYWTELAMVHSHQRCKWYAIIIYNR